MDDVDVLRVEIACTFRRNEYISLVEEVTDYTTDVVDAERACVCGKVEVFGFAGLRVIDSPDVCLFFCEIVTYKEVTVIVGSNSDTIVVRDIIYNPAFKRGQFVKGLEVAFSSISAIDIVIMSTV